MALNSPGVQVSVIDESFYLPAAPSTVPLIFVTSAANKENASGTGTAPGTLAANAGKVYLITSQRDLTDTFGTPLFYTDNSGNPVHGGEQNEYGLQAAYSVLGVSSRAYVVRADIDTSQLTASSSMPEGSPVNGTYWIDTSNTKFGVFEWNKTTGTFTNKVPLVIDNDNYATTTVSGLGVTPKPSFGSNGQYVIVITSDNSNTLWYKNSSGNWVAVGSDVEVGFTASSTFSSTSWKTSHPVIVGTKSSPDLTGYNTNTLVINGETITFSGTTIANLATSINSAMRTKGVGARVNTGGFIELYADARARSNGSTLDGKITIAAGTGLVDMITDAGLAVGTFNGTTLFQAPHYKYPDFGNNPTGSVYIKTTSPNAGSDWYVKLYNESAGSFSLQDSGIYLDPQTAINSIDATGDIPTGRIFIQQNSSLGAGTSSTSTVSPQLVSFKVHRRNASGATKVTSVATTGTITTTSNFVIYEGLATSTDGVADYSNAYTVSLVAGDTIDSIVQKINAKNMTYVTASVATTVNGAATSLTIQHSRGGEILLKNGTATPLTTLLGFSAWSRSAKV